MEYQALYRKHRPQVFSQVVGQRHVTDTLAREVVEGKVAHAYLFAGPRGTGKTTTARILAKALNCENRGPDGEPDDSCSSCVAITEGSSLDVIELDAASHNKVEDIREIRVNVGTVASVGGARRVYILDEAHMLSRAAGNALLKTLEEPPEHVIFVLATTEPYKLLDTIRSRSQRFDFHPIGTEVLTAHLQDISEREGFEPEPGALAQVSQHARGSVRDALSLLEQVAALGGGAVTTQTVGRALGVADPEAYSRLADALVEHDAAAGLSLVAALAAEGSDLRRFVADAVGFFRGVFLAQYAPNLEEIVDESADTIGEWRLQAARLSSGDVLRAVDRFSEALAQLREGREERLVVELAVLRLTRPETATDAGSLAARIDLLEDRLRSRPEVMAPAPADAPERTAPSPASPPTPSPPPAAAVAAAPVAAVAVPAETTPEDPAADVSPATDPIEPAEEAPIEALDLEPATEPPVAAPAPVASLDIEALEVVWPALVARVRDEAGPRRNAWFRETRPGSVDGDVITLLVPEHLHFHLQQLEVDDDLRSLIAATAGELLGGPVRIVYRSDGGAQTSEEEPSVEGTRVPEKHELSDGPAGGIDPAELVVDMLDGEIVE